MSVTIVVLLLVTGFLNVKGQRFDSSSCSELRRCEDELDKFNRPNSRITSYECRDLISNLNCVMRSISCVREEERDNYGIKIQKARSVITSSCENDVWHKRACYDNSEFRNCEDKFPRRASFYSRENCRFYEDFQNCIRRAYEGRCRGDDNEYLTMYMLDVGKELSWKCPQYSSSFSPSSSSPSWNNGRGPYNNTDYKRFNGEICCRNERCGEDRKRQCRDSLQRISDSSDRGRDGSSRDLKDQCGNYMNSYNCYMWHNYQCVGRHDKDSNLLNRARSAIDNYCDVRGDIQRSPCYTSIEIRNCEREIDRSRGYSCSDYRKFYECVERYVTRSCSSDQQLLMGYFLVTKVNDKAWTCSYSEDSIYRPSYDGSSTYPDDDQSCEALARENFRHCEERMEKFENEARNTANSRERHVKSCCSALTYRECIREVVKQKCGRENSQIVDGLMGSSYRYRISNCGEINYSTCSGARTLSNILFMVAALIFSKFYFK